MSAEKPELRPCPFCGGEAFVSYIDGEFAVECVDCECGTRYGKQDEAIAAWNRLPHDGHKCAECVNCNAPDGMDQSWCTHIREMVPFHGEACSAFEPNEERVTK